MDVRMQNAECQIRRTLSAEAREVATFGHSARDVPKHSEKRGLKKDLKNAEHQHSYIYIFVI